MVVLLNISDEPFEFQVEDLGAAELLLGSDAGSDQDFDGVIGPHAWVVVRPV
jgi:hypothetical protein